MVSFDKFDIPCLLAKLYGSLVISEIYIPSVAISAGGVVLHCEDAKSADCNFGAKWHIDWRSNSYTLDWHMSAGSRTSRPVAAAKGAGAVGGDYGVGHINIRIRFLAFMGVA